MSSICRSLKSRDHCKLDCSLWKSKLFCSNFSLRSNLAFRDVALVMLMYIWEALLSEIRSLSFNELFVHPIKFGSSLPIPRNEFRSDIHQFCPLTLACFTGVGEEVGASQMNKFQFCIRTTFINMLLKSWRFLGRRILCYNHKQAENGGNFFDHPHFKNCTSRAAHLDCCNLLLNSPLQKRKKHEASDSQNLLRR